MQQLKYVHTFDFRFRNLEIHSNTNETQQIKNRNDVRVWFIYMWPIVEWPYYLR